MATVRIAADAVRDACAEQISEFERRRDEEIEASIQKRMSTPVRRGIWPWSYDHYPTRAEAEARMDAAPDSMFRGPPREEIKMSYYRPISIRKSILGAAEAALSGAGDKVVNLDEVEVWQLGLGRADEVAA